MAIEYLDHPLRAHGVRSFNAEGSHQELADLGHLSNAIVIPATASIVHTTGQVGKLNDGSIPSDVFEEYQLAFENVKIALEAAGVEEGWRAVYKVNYLSTGGVSEELASHYGNLVKQYCGSNRPAQTGYETTGIMWPGAHIELTVEAVKVVPS